MSSSSTLSFASGAASGANFSFPSGTASSAPLSATMLSEASTPQASSSFASTFVPFLAPDAGQGSSVPLGVPPFGAFTLSGAPSPSTSSVFPGVVFPSERPSYAEVVAGTFARPLATLSDAPHPAFVAPTGEGVPSVFPVPSPTSAAFGSSASPLSSAPAVLFAHAPSNGTRGILSSLVSPGAPLAVAVYGNGGTHSSSAASSAAFPFPAAVTAAPFSFAATAAPSPVAAIAAPFPSVPPSGGGVFSRYAAASAATQAVSSASSAAFPFPFLAGAPSVFQAAPLFPGAAVSANAAASSFLNSLAPASFNVSPSRHPVLRGTNASPPHHRHLPPPPRDVDTIRATPDVGAALSRAAVAAMAGPPSALTPCPILCGAIPRRQYLVSFQPSTHTRLAGDDGSLSVVLSGLRPECFRDSDATPGTPLDGSPPSFCASSSCDGRSHKPHSICASAPPPQGG